MDTADFGVAVVTTANTEPVLSKSTTTQGSPNSELEVHVSSDESNEGESTISEQSTNHPATPLSEDSESKGQADGSNLQVTTSKRNQVDKIQINGSTTTGCVKGRIAPQKGDPVLNQIKSISKQWLNLQLQWRV